METATRARVRRAVHPTNPAWVTLADAAVRFARLVDGGDTREMARRELALTLSHMRTCGPEAGVIDGLTARRAARLVEMYERTADQFRGE
ncbi:hypothetical protein [Verrucosispora sp. WMMD1129]|uniref:hypothetical protein n=1 Tax=Verrucosispora sp. WMMD1129 TaxID=3016093 RepID=UPI002499E331|nr:hypothetical protein [Verrucosispora sp. WMMD1129]WFE44273.1 hypothetical protein O7624_07955 [Verrucosispora sp. WMMD1129]